MQHIVAACWYAVATMWKYVPDGECASDYLRCVYRFGTKRGHQSNRIVVEDVWRSPLIYHLIRKTPRLHSLMGMMLYLEQKGRTYAPKHIVRLSIRAIYSASLSLQIRFMLQRYKKIYTCPIILAEFNNFLTKSSYLCNNIALLLHRF